MSCALALTIACDIHPLNNLRVLKRLADMGIDRPARDDWYRHWIARASTRWRRSRARAPAPSSFGDTPTLADICLVPQMFNARRFEVPLDAYPDSGPRRRLGGRARTPSPPPIRTGSRPPPRRS